jgi:hypothetical protein
MCCVDCDGKGNDWDDEGGIVAETTAARGGSVRACESAPLAVGGRLLLDPGRPSREERPKLNVLEKGRKDCDCCCP